MRPILLCIAISLACAYTPSVGAQEAKKKPNLIVIIADDLGWGDVGFHGSDIATPTLDRLTREGVELRRFYTYPTCSPTRASLLSGRNAARFGLSPIRQLPSGTITLPQVLQKAGYRTALVGKWHLGMEANPNSYGFNDFYGYLGGKIHHLGPRESPEEQLYRNLQPLSQAGHTTDLFTREALALLESDDSRPLYLQLAYSSPHYPLEEEAAWVKPFESSISDPERRLYAAMVAHMDDAIGRVVAAVKKRRSNRESVVLFMSDNGAQKDRLQAQDHFGRWKRLGSNGSLRGWKESLYEGGIRVPALFWRTGKQQPRLCDEPIAVWDLFPTLANMAGAQLPVGLDGLDVRAALEGGRLPARRLFWQTPEAAALREGDDKLILPDQRSPKSAELYHLRSDSSETTNLAPQSPKTAALMAELQRLAPPPPARSHHRLLPIIAAGVATIVLVLLAWRTRYKRRPADAPRS